MELLDRDLEQLRCINDLLDVAANLLKAYATGHRPTVCHLHHALCDFDTEFEKFLAREILERESCQNGPTNPSPQQTKPSSESSAPQRKASSEDSSPATM